MNKSPRHTSATTLVSIALSTLISVAAQSAGSCVICPYGYTCAGGTNAPVKVANSHVCPPGTFWNNAKILRYDSGAIKYEGDSTTPQTTAACDDCPKGGFCPVLGETPLGAPAPVGSIIYVANADSVAYDSTFAANLDSAEKVALGLVQETYTDSECPAGYLFADGSLLNIKDYPALFKKIGNAYSGTLAEPYKTFKLPDLRDAFIRGTGGENAAAVGTKQDSDNKAHTHDYKGSGWPGGSFSNAINITTGSAAIQMDLITDPSGDSESRPINYAMYACIKY